jgi:hypothetical protein
MKFWLLRPTGIDFNDTDTSTCWGCVVGRQIARPLSSATSALPLGGDFPDGWDFTEAPADGPPAVVMFDY